MYMDKRKREKEVEPREILQELKKQTFINFMLSSYVVIFTIALFAYEADGKNYLAALLSGLGSGIVIVLYISHKLKKKNKIKIQNLMVFIPSTPLSSHV